MVGYEANYEVSDMGRVRRARRSAAGQPAGYTLKPRVVSHTGYHNIALSNGDWRNRKYVAIHRMVIAAFVGPIVDGMVVDHINGVRTDNRLYNLQMVTHQENMRLAAVRHGGQIGGVCLGEANAKAKLSYMQVRIIRAIQRIGVGRGWKASLARDWNVSKTIVTNIANGFGWPDVSPGGAIRNRTEPITRH